MLFSIFKGPVIDIYDVAKSNFKNELLTIKILKKLFRWFSPLQFGLHHSFQTFGCCLMRIHAFQTRLVAIKIINLSMFCQIITHGKDYYTLFMTVPSSTKTFRPN